MVFEKQLTQTLQYLVDKIHIKSSIKHDEYDFLVHTTVILEIKRIYYIYNINSCAYQIIILMGKSLHFIYEFWKIK